MKSLKEKMEFIRVSIDQDVIGCDIESVVEKGKGLSQLIGLSAECKAEAKRNLEKSRVLAVASLATRKLPPSVLLKLADAECADQLADFEYADRLNAGITHQLDYYRTIISLHKTELETSMKQP
jgi:hypothetical protein